MPATLPSSRAVPRMLAQTYSKTCACKISNIPFFHLYRRSFSSPSSSSSSSCSSPPPKLNLLNYTSDELVAQLLPLGIPSYRAHQIFHFLYRKGATSFSSMSSLSLSLRRHLSSLYCIDFGKVIQQQESEDGTRKLLLEVGRGDKIESVFIPMRSRSDDDDGGMAGAVCVSSQVACSLQCAFCATGAMDKSNMRNLQPHEIIGQVMHALHSTGNYTAALPAAYSPSTATPHTTAIDSITNLVFMGQGEPGYNVRALRTAISILSDSHGLGFGRKRITISTSGVVPAIDRWKEWGVRLAISLHAVTDELRNELVPINKQWNISQLLEACRRFQTEEEGERKGSKAVKGSRGRITFEYVMLQGVNDSTAEARELCRLLRHHQIDALINLIPFNPWPGSRFSTSSNEAVFAFASECGKTMPVTIRWPKGRDIQAACGQLASTQKVSLDRGEGNGVRRALEVAEMH